MSPLRFVLDENLRGVLLDAIHRHNVARPQEAVDVVQVGDEIAPPRGTPDPELLNWAETENRLLVSFDKSTLPVHLREHLAAGRHCPGILIPPPKPALKVLIRFLVVIAYASFPDEYKDQIKYLKM
jgi:hypothetical protein